MLHSLIRNPKESMHHQMWWKWAWSWCLGNEGDDENWVKKNQRRILLSFLACLPKVLVGANSPNLWPTIRSVMKTGMCFLPLWTAIVCPIIVGKIVDALDQVTTISFSSLAFSFSIFTNRWEATKGNLRWGRGPPAGLTLSALPSSSWCLFYFIFVLEKSSI